MINASDRRQAVELIKEAVDSGAALYKACAELGISKRTYNRWKNIDSDYIDKRTICVRPEPANKLTSEAKQLTHRGRERQKHKRSISTHKATGLNQVWMWDITCLKESIKGKHYYLVSAD